MDDWLDKLISSQDDWTVVASENTYIIVPISNIEETDDEE